MKMVSIFLVILALTGFGIYWYLDNLLPNYILAVYDEENNILVPEARGWALFKSMWIPCLFGAFVATILSSILIVFFYEMTERVDCNNELKSMKKRVELVEEDAKIVINEADKRAEYQIKEAVKRVEIADKRAKDDLADLINQAKIKYELAQSMIDKVNQQKVENEKLRLTVIAHSEQMNEKMKKMAFDIHNAQCARAREKNKNRKLKNRIAKLEV